MVNAAKLFVASLLVVMLLALGGLTVAGPSGLASFFASATVAQQAAQASPAAAVDNTQASSDSSPVTAAIASSRLRSRVSLGLTTSTGGGYSRGGERPSC